MSEYNLEIKQIVEYPRCRIYRQFVHSLIADRNIRASGGSGLFHYTVLCSLANYRISKCRLGSINYTVFAGEWICKITELTALLRAKNRGEMLGILINLQKRHLITYEILGRGNFVKFRILNWNKNNSAFDYNAPCQKDNGFFFLPISTANELISTQRASEMDILLDLWVNTVYNDNRVQGSHIGPVVYMRNGSGNPLVSYETLARRWNMSKPTVGRYLKKLRDLGYITLNSFSGTYGTVIYLQNYLSTMFCISDVMLDKEEIAMALNIKLDLDDSVSTTEDSVSNSNTEKIMQKVEQALISQGFQCSACRNFKYKLFKLSDCKGKSIKRYRLLLYCGEYRKTGIFELTVSPTVGKEILK